MLKVYDYCLKSVNKVKENRYSGCLRDFNDGPAILSYAIKNIKFFLNLSSIHIY